MNDDKMYKEIEKLALLIMAVIALVCGIVSMDLMNGLSVVFGGILNIIGFRNIVVSSKNLLNSPHASRNATIQYMIRFILYGILIYLGMQVGLSIVFMLLGFLSVNLAIKIHTLRTRKEEI